MLDFVNDGLDRDKGAGAACLGQVVQQNAGLRVEILEGRARRLAEGFCVINC